MLLVIQAHDRSHTKMWFQAITTGTGAKVTNKF